MPDSRVAVGIVGAGPAGLLLGHLLHLAGIDSVTVEIRSESHVIERVRAGVLEQGSVDLLHQTGLGARLAREGMRHEGLFLAFNGERHHVDLAGLTGGRAITVYGQNEVVRDLLAARHQAGARLLFEAEDVRLSDVESDRPRLHAREEGHAHVFTCDYLVGCDGSHGISRPSLPAGAARIYEGVPPFAWLGVLARAAPSSHQLVYSLHERGFALFSMRTPEITRLYLQCPPDDAIEQWSDDRIWDELLTRLHTRDGWRPTEGPILQKSITGLRSVVTDPMRCGRLFLAGDAAHIVPATGAKGLNLAIADVWRLAGALADRYRTGSQTALDAYSVRGVRRTWRAQRFSWWMTSMLHRTDAGDTFHYRRQIADLDYLVSSRAAMTGLAENYAGLPLD